MKNLVLLFLLFGNIANAQDYQPFPEFNASWEEGFWNFAGQVVPTYTVLCGDTILDNQVHSKVYNLQLDSVGQISDWHYVGGLREDNDKRVWLTYPNDFTELLYDFNLEVGDTFSTVPSMIVTSIGVEFVNGQAHRSIEFGSFSGLPHEVWIEGVGSSYGMLTRGFYAADYTPFMKCFSIDGQIHYDFNTGFPCTFSFMDDACDVINSSREIAKSDIQIQTFPNPFSEELFLKIATESSLLNGVIEVYNSLGMKVLEKKILFEEEYFDIQLSDGITGGYFLVIKNEAGMVIGKGKVLKN